MPSTKLTPEEAESILAIAVRLAEVQHAITGPMKIRDIRNVISETVPNLREIVQKLT
jgi:hypothetical protein